MISTVNLAEIGTRLADRGMSDSDIREVVGALGMTVMQFDEELAYASAALRPRTRIRGLSLGDRACLSLASHLNLPALTADKIWADVDVEVEVRLIRG
jgi:PIN domain nuclease of toxin-antitoxin system